MLYSTGRTFTSTRWVMLNNLENVAHTFLRLDQAKTRLDTGGVADVRQNLDVSKGQVANIITSLCGLNEVEPIFEVLDSWGKDIEKYLPLVDGLKCDSSQSSLLQIEQDIFQTKVTFTVNCIINENIFVGMTAAVTLASCYQLFSDASRQFNVHSSNF